MSEKQEPKREKETPLIFRLSFSGVEKASVMFLMKHYDLNDPKKLVRFLVSSANDKIKSKMVMYGKGNSPLQEKKARQDEAIREIRDIENPEELLAYAYK